MSQTSREKRRSKAAKKATRLEAIALETKINRAMHSLDSSCEALRSLERDIELFLTDYYEQVGGYFEQLESLERELEEFKENASNALPVAKRIFEEMDVMPMGQTHALEKDVKQLYHTMAKKFHPDIKSGSEAIEAIKDDVIKTLNDAYSRKSYTDLLKIKLDMDTMQFDTNMPNKEKVSVLQSRLAQVEKAVKEVEKRRIKLEESPACALFQRAFQMRLCGQDFVEHVTQDVQQQIENRRRELVSRKVRHLYMEAQTIRENYLQGKTASA